MFGLRAQQTQVWHLKGNFLWEPPRVFQPFNPFPTLIAVLRSGSGEVPPEACMALPGPAKGLAVATVTYINYPSRRKP